MSASPRRVFASLGLAATLATPVAHALTFDLDYGDGIQGTLNTTLTAGAGFRMQDRASYLVGKANLNPGVCGGAAQSCQGVFRDQTLPARTLAASPGQAYLNADNGNLNYDKGDLTQSVIKATQDLTLTYGEIGFFAKWLYFYDFTNNHFLETWPNVITPENRDRVGVTGAGNSNAVFDRTYGPGEPTLIKRSDGETLRQIGTDLQMFDYYLYGTLPIAGKELTWKLGNQTVNWGESTALVINSVNQVNPVNANNLLRVGFDLSELFIPTGMLYLSMEPFENTTVEFYYGYDWEPVEIPAAGSFFSFADIGVNNAGDSASISFGGPAEDPFLCERPNGPPGSTGTATNPDSGCGTPLNNPLSGLTSTSTTIRRLEDRVPEGDGQFGLSFKYFADWLNNGTELAFYFVNYHSQLPLVSFYATDMACARAGADHSVDGGMDMNATNGIELLLACPDLPVMHPSALVPGADPRDATSNAVPIDTVQFFLEYPQDLQMYGFSFNTTAGDFSIQGEMAFRPDSPLQVDTQDLTFHALGPMLTRCHDESVGCLGSNAGVSGDGQFHEDSDFTPYPGTGISAYPDTFDLAIGAAVGSARSFPSFVGAYRGVAPGETPPNSYIRGWETFDVWQFNLGGTYIQGATDNPIGADQVIWLLEVGAQAVPDLPDTSVLQIESPGTHYHASAGADGSMTGNYAQDCAHTVDCHYAPDGSGDGLRFNPHQEPAEGYADDFSWGYVLINLIRYESVFPGISFAPITIFQHDVKGTSTDAAAQFTEGRMDIQLILETRYQESMSFNVGYFWFTGGGVYNLHKDRDQAIFFAKYQF